MAAYTTKIDAMNAIRNALGEYEHDYDLDGIFSSMYHYDDAQGGFVEDEDVDFWDVADHYDTTIDRSIDEWKGEGFYSIGYTDGGMDFTNNGPVWCDSECDLAGLISGANVNMTETHIPVVYFEGTEEI